MSPETGGVDVKTRENVS